METEIWKTIPSYPAYEASTEGRIRSKKGHILYTCRNNCDYEIVVLFVNNRPKCIPVHRLVAQTFLTNPDNLSDVDHIDGNKSNNRLSNLQYLSHRENCKKYQMEKKYMNRILLSVAQNHWINIYAGKNKSFQGTYITPTGITVDYFTCTDILPEMEKLSSLFPDFIFSIYSDAGNLYIQGTRRV